MAGKQTSKHFLFNVADTVTCLTLPPTTAAHVCLHSHCFTVAKAIKRVASQWPHASSQAVHVACHARHKLAAGLHWSDAGHKRFPALERLVSYEH